MGAWAVSRQEGGIDAGETVREAHGSLAWAGLARMGGRGLREMCPRRGRGFSQHLGGSVPLGAQAIEF